MKKVFLLALAVITVCGCASFMKPKAKAGAGAGEQPLPSYSGPKARLAVADFEVKAAKAGTEIGSGLREMLVSALSSSNRFSVLERQELSAVMQEQESGAQQGSGAPQRGKARAAELIISAAVTEFEPASSGGAAGVGGGGGSASGMLGGLLGAAVNKEHLAMDIRIVDTSTTEVLSSARVQGEAFDVAGGMTAGFSGGYALSGGLGAYANTPMEKAIRICIVEAVRYIAGAIPQEYYKY